jgi:plasmid maintenance system antidote protein VapI
MRQAVLYYNQSHDMRQYEGRRRKMQLNKLKAKIVEKGMNVESLADMIGLDRSSLYRKLNNFEKITIGEAVKMKSALEMTDAEASDIFLS